MSVRPTARSHTSRCCTRGTAASSSATPRPAAVRGRPGSVRRVSTAREGHPRAPRRARRERDRRVGHLRRGRAARRDGARELGDEGPRITMPAEDVSYQLTERFFARCDVRFDTVFLRWDKTRTAQLLAPRPDRAASIREAAGDLGPIAQRRAGRARAGGRVGGGRQRRLVASGRRRDPPAQRRGARGAQRAQPAPAEPLRGGRPARELPQRRRPGALDGDARRGPPDRARPPATGCRRGARSCT